MNDEVLSVVGLLFVWLGIVWWLCVVMLGVSYTFHAVLRRWRNDRWVFEACMHYAEHQHKQRERSGGAA